MQADHVGISDTITLPHGPQIRSHRHAADVDAGVQPENSAALRRPQSG
jgi:hypothetical protein